MKELVVCSLLASRLSAPLPELPPACVPWQKCPMEWTLCIPLQPFWSPFSPVPPTPLLPSPSPLLGPSAFSLTPSFIITHLCPPSAFLTRLLSSSPSSPSTSLFVLFPLFSHFSSPPSSFSPSAPTPSTFPCSSPPTPSWPLLLPDKERLGKRWMEMTCWLWRDCHPVMHWEPSPAFCGSHTDETVTPRHAGSRTPGGQRTKARRGKLGQCGLLGSLLALWAFSSRAPAGHRGPSQSPLRSVSLE